MRRRTGRWSTLTLAVGTLAVLLAVAAGAVDPVGAVPAAEPAAARKVVIVGDSVIIGARPEIEAAFANAGWQVVFDGESNLSTLAGARVVASHAADLTDTLVVNLGANDGGNPVSLRERVEAVMAAAGDVPHVYWLTVPEVRSSFATTNKVLREVIAGHPNAEVIDWNALSSSGTDLTAADGLRLTPSGATAMAEAVAGTVLADAQSATTTKPTSSTSVTTATTAPTTTRETSAPQTTTIPTAAGDEEAVSATTAAADDSNAGWVLPLVLVVLVVAAVAIVLGTRASRRRQRQRLRLERRSRAFAEAAGSDPSCEPDEVNRVHQKT